MIQKGLAFRRKWSGTVANPERWTRSEILPPGLIAEVGLRWCGQDAFLNRTEDLNV
jgi:hypothetical protein